MKIFELFQPIVEGYKEAQTDFEKSVDVAEVKSTIDAYKQLVNKNQYQGILAALYFCLGGLIRKSLH
jgi:hypothetical protein